MLQSPPTGAVFANRQASEWLAGNSEALGGPYQLDRYEPPWYWQASKTLPGLVGSAQRRRQGRERFAVYPFGVVGAAVSAQRRKVERSARKPGNQQGCSRSARRRHWLGARLSKQVQTAEAR